MQSTAGEITRVGVNAVNMSNAHLVEIVHDNIRSSMIKRQKSY